MVCGAKLKEESDLQRQKIQNQREFFDIDQNLVVMLSMYLYFIIINKKNKVVYNIYIL